MSFFLVLLLLSLGSAATCLGDLNSDNTVDLLDVTYILDRFGSCPLSGSCFGDMNGDGKRDRADLSILLIVWGPCFTQGTTNPTATFPPDPTTTPVPTSPTTTLPPTTTTVLPTLPPTTTTTGQTTTPFSTTAAGSTLPPDAIVPTFRPVIGPGCSAVQPGALLVYWFSTTDEGASRCSGTPQFIFVGDSENAFCIQSDWGTVSFGYFTDVTFLSCAIGRKAVCAFSAVANVGSSSAYDQGFRYHCTTGAAFPPEESYNGTNLPSYQIRPPVEGRNEFATNPDGSLMQAPFNIGNCHSPPVAPTGGVFRSYRPYCSSDQIPSQWQNLPRTNQPIKFTV